MYHFRYIILLILLSFSGFCAAHPHSYIDLNSKWITEQNNLTAIDFEWQLDEMTSLSLTYDIFQQMPYPQAMKKIADELLSNMQENEFFTHITSKNSPLAFHIEPNSHKAEQKGLKTSFFFTLKLDKPIELKTIRLNLSTYEESYYVSMGYNDVSNIDASQLPVNCQTELVNPNHNQALQNYAQSLDLDDMPEDDLNLGRQFAQDVVLICK